MLALFTYAKTIKAGHGGWRSLGFAQAIGIALVAMLCKVSLCLTFTARHCAVQQWLQHANTCGVHEQQEYAGVTALALMAVYDVVEVNAHVAAIALGWATTQAMGGQAPEPRAKAGASAPSAGSRGAQPASGSVGGGSARARSLASRAAKAREEEAAASRRRAANRDRLRSINDKLYKRARWQLVQRVAVLALTGVAFTIGWRAVAGSNGPQRPPRHLNPIATEAAPWTRILSTQYLVAVHARWLLWPLHLSHNWCFGSLPMVRNLMDWHNLVRWSSTTTTTTTTKLRAVVV